ncbi:hypothetical protein V8F20_001637 [Naviculisporaceae sp. PSN 640]
MGDTSRNRQMDPDAAKLFLEKLLNKNLRVTTTDSRMFWGSFKCTDAESNIILHNTYEYRHPSPSSIAQAAVTATATITSAVPSSSEITTEPPAPLSITGKPGSTATETTPEIETAPAPRPDTGNGTSNGTGTVKLDMTSRYLGLVVIPGQHIVKIELEEFASQVTRTKNKKAKKKNTIHVASFSDDFAPAPRRLSLDSLEVIPEN